MAYFRGTSQVWGFGFGAPNRAAASNGGAAVFRPTEP